MKRTDLMKTIKKAAKAADLDFSQTEGGSHTKIVVGTKTTTVPRHNEIVEHTARLIFKQLEEVLGKDWWK